MVRLINYLIETASHALNCFEINETSLSPLLICFNWRIHFTGSVVRTRSFHFTLGSVMAFACRICALERSPKCWKYKNSNFVWFIFALSASNSLLPFFPHLAFNWIGPLLNLNKPAAISGNSLVRNVWKLFPENSKNVSSHIHGTYALCSQ